jgi:hypothetical protein
MTELKVDDQQEVLNQLKALGDLVSKTEEDEYSLTERGVSVKASGQYQLTEKGHDSVSDMIAYPEIKADNYKEKIEEKFHSKQAYQRHKLAYILLGIAGALFLCFSGSALFTIISRVGYGGPSFFFGDGLPFLFTLFIIAPLVGGTVGYLIGKTKNFKRPEPEWNE